VNKLKLKLFNDECIVYLYQPEGKGEWGEITFVIAENKATVTRIAEDSSPAYAYKATKRVEDCARDKRGLDREFTQAWY